MLAPETYLAALCLTILTMLCWGSWANTLKLCPGYRFQLFYWDYAIGMAVGDFLLGIDGGEHGARGNAVPARRGADAGRAHALRHGGRRDFQRGEPAARRRNRRSRNGGGLPGGHRTGAGDRRNFKLRDQAGGQSRCCCLAEWRWWWWRLCWTRRPIANAKPRPRRRQCAASSSAWRAAC